MKRLVLAWLFASTFILLPAQNRGDLIGAQPLASLTYPDIQQIYNQNGILEIFSPIEYDVKAYKLVYWTPAATGDSLTFASGLLLVPQGDCDFPLFCYAHGTQYYGQDVSDLQGEYPIGLAFAANGYLTAMPDYLGYGATPISHPHPYVHAATEASATIDMLRATRQWASQQAVRLSEQVFLSGYSQGGHVAMATARTMETDLSSEFSLTAVVPGSGPYDVSATTRDSLLAERPTSAFYLAFVMTSYQYVYGSIWNVPSDILVPPYDQWVPEFFDRENPIPRPLPDTAVRMLRPEVVATVRQDSLHPINLALRDNDVYDWTPQVPMRMYYCEADEQVPYTNALVAQAAFQQNGSTSTIALSAGPELDHVSCAIPTLLFAKGWFDSMRDTCTTRNSTGLLTAAEAGLRLGPNPFGGVLRWNLPEGHGFHQLSLYDTQGRRIRQETLRLNQGSGILSGQALPRGMYFLVWQGPRSWLRAPVWKE
ncbi:MAG: alpha/beta fold hydrolase [Bacteroidetes bacterium]|nr:MAG: alpha/beta fold hydrolase [Bacteroidota bacterium]